MSHAFAAEVDEVTVARARKGDLAALEDVFRAFETPVFNLARRLLGNGHDAEDVLQETFLEVIRSIRSYRGDGPLGAWLRRVTASKALMRLRRQRVRPEDEPLDDAIGDGDGHASHPPHPSRVPERVDLEAALAEMSATARAVVWLHDVEGYTHDEIATLMGKSASFSKSQLARAHLRLRALLAPGGDARSCTQA
ncbi:MAG: RNA polymerase sigma factor [Acidobacteriota bacterium]